MSESKFTKGEWVACVDEDSCWVDSVEGGLLADITHADVSNSESDANAHLIAAAPSMYEVLEDVLEILPNSQYRARKGIESLLAKARGE